MSNFLLIKKIVVVDMKHWNPLELGKGNGFQKEIIDILEKSFIKTHSGPSLWTQMKVCQLKN